MKRFAKYLAVICLSTFLALNTLWAAYPDRPVTIIVHWGAGGGTDTIIRILAIGFEESIGPILNGLISLLFGLWVAMIGIDQVAGQPRFTIGSMELMGRISVIPAMIGMFALAEILRNLGLGQIKKTLQD